MGGERWIERKRQSDRLIEVEKKRERDREIERGSQVDSDRDKRTNR